MRRAFTGVIMRDEILERLTIVTTRMAALAEEMALLKAEKSALEAQLAKQTPRTLTHSQRDAVRKAARMVANADGDLAARLLKIIGGADES